MKALLQKTVIILALVLASQAEAKNTSSIDAANTMSASTGSTLDIVPNIGITNFHLVNSDQGMSSRSGISLGADVDLQTPVDGLYAETGISYFEGGAKNEYIFASQEIKLGYIAVPLKAKYELYHNADYKVYGKAGASLAYLASASTTVEVFGTSQSDDIKNKTNAIDLIGVVALGGDIPIWGGRGNIELEYDKGTQKTFKDQGDKIEGYVLKAGYAISL